MVSAYGLIGSVSGGAYHRGLPGLWSFQSDLGSGVPGTGVTEHNRLKAGGRSTEDEATARMLAIAEGAERYSGAQFTSDGVVTGTAAELSGRVLNFRHISCCSEQEYANPGCPLVPFAEEAPIRWVKGVDLRDGVDTWVPLVMAGYRLPHRVKAEHFIIGISTGYAVHVDPAEALFGGLCEVVERDMIALVWLQKLPLPHVPMAALGAREHELIEWSRRHFVETVVLDATSDIGIPTAYCVQIAPHDEKAYTIVGCGTGLTIAAAAYKALLESIGIRGHLHEDWTEPDSFADFHDIADGARFMGKPKNKAHFDFLLGTTPARPSYVDRGTYAADPASGLARAVQRFTELDMPVIAVDRTTTELADVGLCAVTVIIPDLQPMSLTPLAQYRAHPRLYSAPGAMGYRTLTHEELNQWPQPFA
ncbi:hypothetical protein Rhe02_38260 [Rhizocola hellebori]|uniref:YcaO domain-containing protein n=1 Tax=Rhizocola hellebori TaxID=1392758 RepID=A0A8J3Q823_9ACTN|nr:hypothetical protein Rhe02_38260 [Rhizocola hellebori]